MAYILCLDTATKMCSVALSKDGSLLDSEEYLEDSFSHAEVLHVLIDKLFKRNNLSFKELSAVAISKGPGSFTGLKIGVSTAKGICFPLSIPIIGIDTLEVLGRAIKINSNELIFPLLDARRDAVYLGGFNENYDSIYSSRYLSFSDKEAKEDLESTLNKYSKIFLLGDGSDKLQEYSSLNHLEKTEFIYPKAKNMSEVAFEKYQNQDFEELKSFEPAYLKSVFVNSKLS